MRKNLFTMQLAFAGLLGFVPPAQADVTECRGTLPPGVYQNIVVPTPSDCVITGPTQILGNVHVERDASLTIGEAGVQTRVEQNIVSNRGRFVLLLGGASVGENVHILGATEFSGCDTGPFIGGNLIFEGLVGPDSVAHACGCHVRGSVHVFNGVGLGVDIDGNIVEQELLIYNNTSEVALLVVVNRVFDNLHLYGNTGPSLIAFNEIGHALQCHNNTPPPFAAGNVAEKTDCPAEEIPLTGSN